MNFRTVISTWTGTGAAENARRSLDEWNRAQDEVASLLDRVHSGDAHRADPPTTHTAA